MTTPLTAEPTAALGPGVAAARAEAAPVWLAARRRIAWDTYEALPMPSSHSDEDWRRTDISGLHVERFAPLEHVDVAVLDAMRADTVQSFRDDTEDTAKRGAPYPPLEALLPKVPGLTPNLDALAEHRRIERNASFAAREP